LPAREQYRLLLNLGLLGFSTLLSLFEIAIAKEKFFESFYRSEDYYFSVGTMSANTKVSTLEELKIKNKNDILLTLKIFADKQYDYDQKIYLAEGNVKVIINGGILRADFLRYEKLKGILSAEGNVRFTKGEQLFQGKEFRFNLFKKEGIIKDVFGILDIKNTLDDLNIHYNSEETLEENRAIDKSTNKGRNIYNDGIEFDFGNIKLPKNKITRSNKSVGSINDWRFKSDLINIQENGWKSNRIIFTNDPLDPHQISFEAIDVIAEEVDDGKLIISSSKTNLILENKVKIYLGKRIFGRDKKKKIKFELFFDSEDRDGLALKRRSDKLKVDDNFGIEFEPQFMINRALTGKTNSYEDNQNIDFLDLFGSKIKLNANYKDWEFDSVNDLSTLSTTRLFSGLRHSSSFRKYVEIPILDDSIFNIFTTYRSKAWNGTLGDTEIKSAYGGFIEKKNSFKSGEVKNNLNLRFGTAKYEAEKVKSTEMISLWRSSIFVSLDSEYQISKKNQKNIDQNKLKSLSPVLINPELVFRTKINSAYFNYEDGSDQGFVKFTLGPEIRLGKLERNFLDYTKFSVMPGVKFKSGNSPFKFDNAIDLKTVNISLMQQIYGPLMFDSISNLNIDNSSDNYGEYFDTKLGLLWHRRAYEFGIYFHPDNNRGGLYFRINGFNFDNSVKAEF